MKTIRGVLLDVDGTLLDSNDAHASAWADALAEFGVHRRAQELRRLVGMGSDQLFPQIGVHERTVEISARKKELFYARFLSALQPQPGARALVAELKRRGLARIVATSAGSSEIVDLLRRADVYDLVEHTVTKDDASVSKPAPDIVESAVARTQLSHAELVMLGDTPYDVASARAAGVAVIALRCGGWSDRELVGASAIYDTPQDLLERIDGSLLACSKRIEQDTSP